MFWDALGIGREDMGVDMSRPGLVEHLCDLKQLGQKVTINSRLPCWQNGYRVTFLTLAIGRDSRFDPEAGLSPFCRGGGGRKQGWAGGGSARAPPAPHFLLVL